MSSIMDTANQLLDDVCKVVITLREQEAAIKADRKTAEHKLHLLMKELGKDSYSYSGQVFRFVQQLTINSKLQY